MHIIFVILFSLPLRFITLLLDYLQLAITVYQIIIYCFVDLAFRWIVSKVSLLVPSVNSGVDLILAYLKLAPLNSFPPGHYPRLQAIINAIEQHIQNPQFNPQVINAYSSVLLFIHGQTPEFPADMTVDNIRLRFRDHWPHIAPLNKALCLYLDSTGPIGIRWGLNQRGGIDLTKPTIRVNPYLIQALEVVQEGSDIHAYLQFLTIVAILHEATHLLVQLVSPGVLTPGHNGEFGNQFEMLVLQGATICIEIHEHDVFHLTRAQRLLLQFTEQSFGVLTGHVCREAVDRFLRGEALWVTQPQLPQTTLVRIELVSNTLIRHVPHPSE